MKCKKQPILGSTLHRSKLHHGLFSFTVVSLISLFWLIYKTGTQPGRIRYPCQRAALAQTHIFFSYVAFSFTGGLGTLLRDWGSRTLARKKALILMLILLLALGTTGFVRFGTTEIISKDQSLTLELISCPTSGASVSDVFFVKNASGPNGNMDAGLERLFDLMAQHDQAFYKTTSNLSGVIGSNDLVILKVNSQWSERGGTNTDVLKSLIRKIVEHPEGFKGEIVVADNGQGGGSLDWAHSNAFDISQSAQKVVEQFSSSYRVSAYLWDTIRSIQVSEYDSGDLNDGYVVESEPDLATGMYVSYPKFKTAFDTYVSFKKGIWNTSRGAYDSSRLKLINLPILKSHGGFGVTACIKHYMGVQSQPLSNGHSLIGRGAMGTEIAQTRFPTLNILDCIWVNPIPWSGPSTSYDEASYTNIIGASVDPVALDYVGSKYVLVPAAVSQGYADVSSLDPDNPNGIYHNYLELSTNQLKLASFEVTMNESEMNVWLAPATSPLSGDDAAAPADKPASWAPYLGLASTILIAIAATAIYFKRVKHKKIEAINKRRALFLLDGLVLRRRLFL